MTTSTIMRSKQTSGTSIGRPIHTTRSQYNGGVIYPQWMRSLEEKYQRIHMKIARSTTAMSNIYNSSLGRNSIQEKTLPKASLAKPRESSPGRFSTTQLQYRRVASSLERGVSRTRTSVTDVVTGGTQDNSQKQGVGFAPAKQEDLEFANVNEIDIDKTDVKFNDDVIDLCDDIDKEECDSNSSRVDCDEDNIGYVLGLGHVVSVSSDEDEDEIEKDTNDVKHFEEEQVFNSKESTLLIDQDCSSKEKNLDYRSRSSLRDTNKVSPVKGEPRKHFITQLGKHYQNKSEQFIRREQIPQTSTSRRSIQTHKTSKSCPTTMEHVQAAPQPQTDRGTHVRRKSFKKSYKGQRNSNMFSRMSMEAQHARTEILKEKKPSKKHQQQQQKRNSTSQNLSGCDGGSSSSKEADSEKQAEVVVQNNERKTAQDKAVDRLYNGEDYNKMFTDMNVIPDYEQAYSDSDISVGNRKHAFTVLANRTKLPNIADGKYVTLQHLKTLQYTLPGIGRYSVAPKRETTFEITPPGFDIRYKDMMVLEERESETPPPDIRNRAVQKCQEWLARHTPR
ncbi:uncharacterized protein LOC110456256 [Mizuhopecten yessoensis]|uniref:Uncharacterized protein n=1 Tax=Mizuhopecten yessoensis TaxID=6573 RepID=A0A210QBD1_MIZYE|nr:uncharacterized protein LOC110456256 [Mizuhopecten yessoensis]OWF46040.1 hypothetical protein KP79_PYT01471 [Mizuhopecten yessoensis]